MSDSGARRGELDGQRQVVEAATELGDRRRPARARALAEQRDRLRLGERRHGYSTSPRTRSRSRLVTSSAGSGSLDQRASSGAASTTCSRLSSRSSSSRSPMCSASPSFAPSVCPIVSSDKRRVAHRREVDPEDAGLELGRPAREAASIASRVLPEPPGPAQRHEPCPRTSSRPRSSSRSRPTNEDRRPRQVRVRDRLQRREALIAELEDRHRRREVLQPMLAEVGHAAVAQHRASRATPTPAPVTRGRDPRREVDVLADVALPVTSPARRCAGPSAPGSDRPRAPVSPRRSAASAPGASGTRTKNASPCVSTSTPPRRRTPRAGRADARPAPPRTPPPRARASSRVDPSTSVNRNVTGALGSRRRMPG